MAGISGRGEGFPAGGDPDLGGPAPLLDREQGGSAIASGACWPQAVGVSWRLLRNRCRPVATCAPGMVRFTCRGRTAAGTAAPGSECYNLPSREGIGRQGSRASCRAAVGFEAAVCPDSPRDRGGAEARRGVAAVHPGRRGCGIRTRSRRLSGCVLRGGLRLRHRRFVARAGGLRRGTWRRGHPARSASSLPRLRSYAPAHAPC